MIRPRDLTPLGWLVAGVALLLAIGFIAWSWNNMWSWLPWSDARKLESAEQRADTAESDASARGLESQGQAAQVVRTEAHGDLRIRVEATTAEAINEARSAPDADHRLSPDQLARVRGRDRELCELSPSVCPTTAPDAP